jgi:hypothetical protein
MFVLLSPIQEVLLVFASVFTRPVWNHAQILMLGTILARGKRTVTSACARHGSHPRTTFHQLPPSAQPGGVARMVSLEDPTRVTGVSAARGRAIARTCRRDHRTTQRRQDQDQRGLSRRRSLVSHQGCPLFRPPLGGNDVARSGPLVQATMGTALLHGRSAFPEDLPKDWKTPQKCHRPCLFRTATLAPLVSHTWDSYRGRRRVRCGRIGFGLQLPCQSRHPGGALSLECHTLRSSS